MPVSHYHVFALMPVAQFWEAGISLGMPPISSFDVIIYLSNGIYNASFLFVVMKKGDCTHARTANLMNYLILLAMIFVIPKQSATDVITFLKGYNNSLFKKDWKKFLKVTNYGHP